jgi:hypothetical protein
MSGDLVSKDGLNGAPFAWNGGIEYPMLVTINRPERR